MTRHESPSTRSILQKSVASFLRGPHSTCPEGHPMSSAASATPLSLEHERLYHPFRTIAFHEPQCVMWMCLKKQGLRLRTRSRPNGLVPACSHLQECCHLGGETGSSVHLAQDAQFSYCVG